MKSITRILSAAVLGTLMIASATTLAAKTDGEKQTNQFAGAKANTGMANHFNCSRLPARSRCPAPRSRLGG